MIARPVRASANVDRRARSVGRRRPRRGISARVRRRAGAGGDGAVCAALTVQSTRGVALVKAVAARRSSSRRRRRCSRTPRRRRREGRRALGSTANGAHAVTKLAHDHGDVPFVVDPVGAPSRGRGAAARLSTAAARAPAGPARSCARVRARHAEPRRGAAGLLGVDAITARDAPADAARALVDLGVAAALVKGGHARGAESIDWLRHARGRAPRRDAAPAAPRRCTARAARSARSSPAASPRAGVAAERAGRGLAPRRGAMGTRAPRPRALDPDLRRRRHARRRRGRAE